MPFVFILYKTALRSLSRRLLLPTVGLGLIIAALSGCGNGSLSTDTPPPGLIAPGTTPFNNTRQATASACTANAHVAGRARWTVLMYIDGASNLQDDSNLNVGQMASVGSDGTNVNIVLQWKEAASQTFFTESGIAPAPGDTPAFDGTRRYYLSQHTAADVAMIEGPNGDGFGGNVTPLDVDRLADPATNGQNGAATNTSDMGNVATLQDFVDWGAATYPADHLLVVIWDHGSAALSIASNRSVKAAAGKAVQSLKTLTKAGSAPKPIRPRSVCFDTNTGSQIETEDLPTAFENLGATSSSAIISGTYYGVTQKCDVITVDCSLEGTTEVAYQLRSSARIYTGSEESPPGQGLAYDAWLSALKSGGANPCAVGSSIVSTFVNSPLYAGQNVYQKSITNSMIDLTQMQNVISALDAFGVSLKANFNNYAAPIATARDTSQQYDVPDYTDYKDLYDLANRIRTTSVPVAVQTAALNLQTALVSPSSGAILASAHGSDPPTYTQKYSTGLSIYCPSPRSSPNLQLGGPFYQTEYSTLAISLTGAAPNWALFLQSQTN